MSLIQDALKRQQEEMNKPAATPLGKLETPSVPPPQPIQSKIPLRMMGQPQTLTPPLAPLKPSATPVPPPPVSTATPVQPPPAPPAKSDAAPRVLTHRKTGTAEAPPAPAPQEVAPEQTPLEPAADKRNQVLVAVVLILLISLGIGLYLFWPLGSHSSVASAPAPVSPSVPEVTPVPLPVKPATPVPTTPVTQKNAVVVPPAAPPSPKAIAATSSVPADVVAKPASAALPVAAPPATPPPMPREIAAAPKLPESVPVAVTVPPAATKPPAVTKSPAVTTTPALASAPDVATVVELPAALVVWPPIKLTGLVKLGPTSAALINGKVVAPGETIEGVLLKSVTKDGALVRLEGEERLLRVGETAR